MTTTTDQTEADRRAEIAESDRLYERYGKPLEQEHSGQYLAVSKDGRTLVAATLLEAVDQAVEHFGPENFVFKVGDKDVGEWLWLQIEL